MFSVCSANVNLLYISVSILCEDVIIQIENLLCIMCAGLSPLEKKTAILFI